MPTHDFINGYYVDSYHICKQFVTLTFPLLDKARQCFSPTSSAHISSWIPIISPRFASISSLLRPSWCDELAPIENKRLSEKQLDCIWKYTQIARFMGPTWGPPGDDRTQVGPMLAPWTLLSGYSCVYCYRHTEQSTLQGSPIETCLYTFCHLWHVLHIGFLYYWEIIWTIVTIMSKISNYINTTQ